jgi:ribose 5-phosphate isomerase B
MQEPVLKLLRSWGHPVKDCGTLSTEPVDFPDIARKVTAGILSRNAARGILVRGAPPAPAAPATKWPAFERHSATIPIRPGSRWSTTT